MTARAYALMTGIFILVLVLAIGLATYWFNGNHRAQAPYIVVAHQSVMGLHTQSTVYYRGVPVGDVEAIHLDPKSPQKTLIHIAIYADIPITKSTYAVLHTQGVTGLSTLGLNDKGTSHDVLQTSADAPVTIPLTIGAGGVMRQAQKLGTKLNHVADALKAITSDDNIKHVDAILANTAQLTAQLSTLSQQLQHTAEALPDMAHHADAAFKKVGALADHFNHLTDSLTASAKQLQSLVGTGHTALRELTQQTLPVFDASLDAVKNAAHAFKQLSKNLNQNPQQLLFGSQPRQPGPGESGFSASQK